ncbi:MAG TPA: branched-chain amino acid ABC transporter substrate-binding protein [Candidatus Baltobacteraceae bacterium]|nr:branched-chain amino acid ABC transporter substrate-binding protein [Candidatus Baltobacteraceae bacterium]
MQLPKLGRRVFAVGLAAGVATAFMIGSAGTVLADTVIKIGTDLTVSGGEASQGLPVQQGVLLAIEQANAGAPAGFTFELDALDDAVQGFHNPAQGVANVRTFVADPSLLGIVGPINSNVAKAEIPITNAAGLLQISQSNTNPTLTKGPDAAKLRSKPVNNYFRVCTTDDHQGAAGASFAKKLGYKNVFIIDDNETYGTGLANIFESSFKEGGGTVLGHEHVIKGQQDFKALLTKVASFKPDLIYFGGVTETGGALIRKQMSDVGLGHVGFGAGDGIANAQFRKVTGEAANGVFYTVAAPNVKSLPSAKKFITDYMKRFNEDIGTYSANGYAAAQVIIAAVERGIKENGGQIPTRADVLKNAQEASLSTPIGKVSFDRNGDTTNGIISAYQIKDQKPVFIGEVIEAGT